MLYILILTLAFASHFSWGLTWLILGLEGDGHWLEVPS